jgi:hypothetical protein
MTLAIIAPFQIVPLPILNNLLISSYGIQPAIFYKITTDQVLTDRSII